VRKLTLGIVLVLIVLVSSCRCAAEKAAVDRLQDQQEKVFIKYTSYVQADPKLSAPAKDDELKLLQSLRDIVLALKRSLGE
jgi:hypothetical protein